MEIAFELHRQENQEKLFNEEISFQAEQFGLSQTVLRENKDMLQISEENIQKCDSVWERFRAAWKTDSPRVTFFELHLRILVKYFEKEPKDHYHEPTFRFCVMAFEQNINEMYKMAMEMYDKPSKALVKKTFSGK